MLRTIRSKYSSSGTIVRLPTFEEDEDPDRRDAMTDEEIYARLKPPTTIVVKYGSMGLVAEFPYDGPAKPGCGSKLIARTNRGLEVSEMLTTTCSNSGCGKSISRNEMLEYIERSGGSEYPFRSDGKILRVASISDLNRWSEIQAKTRAQVPAVKDVIAEYGLSDQMSLVELEPILSEEQLTVFYLAEERVDFRDLVQRLARMFGCRIEMRQVGARDEARLVADYERCGQHCCCQNFLKVLKPVSMRSAKTQKATLDPLKISGRCGRLMCCLRYEDETYADLKSRLPHRKTRVGTSEGPGLVIDSKILVQLVLVQLEADGREIAVPVEELCDPDAPLPKAAPESDPLRGMPTEQLPTKKEGEGTARKRRRRRRRKDAKGESPDQQTAFREAAQGEEQAPGSAAESGALAPGDKPTKPKRRRRRRKRSGGGGEQSPGNEAGGPPPSQSAPEGGAEGPKKKRRRRRRRRRGGGSGDQSNPSSE